MIYVFLAITALFALAIITGRLSGRRFCAICVSVALIWLSLLAALKLGRYHDPVLIGLLAGQSITGVFYMLRRRLPAALGIFTLPFLLTLTAVAYWLITNRLVLPAFVLLTALWAAGWLIFSHRHDPGKKELADAVIECCEDL